MGKNLKGKECGKGIYQIKDGLYHARFVDKAGKRHEKYFQTIPEARNWIEQAKYADKHEGVFCPSDTTVDAWFSFWIENRMVSISDAVPLLVIGNGVPVVKKYALGIERCTDGTGFPCATA